MYTSVTDTSLCASSTFSSEIKQVTVTVRSAKTVINLQVKCLSALPNPIVIYDAYAQRRAHQHNIKISTFSRRKKNNQSMNQLHTYRCYRGIMF